MSKTRVLSNATSNFIHSTSIHSHIVDGLCDMAGTREQGRSKVTQGKSHYKDWLMLFTTIIVATSTLAT